MYTSLAEDNDALNTEVARLRELVRDAYFEGFLGILPPPSMGVSRWELETEDNWQNSKVCAKMNNKEAT